MHLPVLDTRVLIYHLSPPRETRQKLFTEVLDALDVKKELLLPHQLEVLLA